MTWMCSKKKERDIFLIKEINSGLNSLERLPATHITPNTWNPLKSLPEKKNVT
jgi:hypothetical protein